MRRGTRACSGAREAYGNVRTSVVSEPKDPDDLFLSSIGLLWEHHYKFPWDFNGSYPLCDSEPDTSKSISLLINCCMVLIA